MYGKISQIIGDLGDPIASTFSARQYLDFRAHRLNQLRKSDTLELSPATQNNQLALLSGLFNRLIKYKQWNFPNPLAEIEPIRRQQRELAYLHEKDISVFLDELGSIVARSVSIPQIVLIAKICLATGARIEEALTLKCSQVSKYKLTFSNTKDKCVRSVPISEALYNEILDNAVSGHIPY